MEKVRVLLLEDLTPEGEALISLLEQHNYEIAGWGRTLSEVLQLMHSVAFDIAIIDVYLNDLPEGIAFAETLNAHPQLSKPFVFLTSSKDRAIFERAKLTRPFAFLLKPFNDLEVLYALEMALEKFYDQEDVLEDDDAGLITENHLFIKKKGALHKVMFPSISHIEVDERYCTLFCGNEKYVVQKSLKQMEALLKPHGFVRTHRKFLVQKQKIQQIILGEDTILLDGGHSVPISDNYKDLTKDLNIL